jgi:hypothetical protein
LCFFKFIRKCWCFKGFIYNFRFAKDIILCENDNIINNQTEVAETFNNFFINVAKDIGSQNIKTDDNHPSIKAIKENKTESDQFI